MGAPRTRPHRPYCRYRLSVAEGPPRIREAPRCRPPLPLTSYARAVCRLMLNAAPAYGQSTTDVQCIGAARRLSSCIEHEGRYESITCRGHTALSAESHSRASMAHVIRLLEVFTL